MKIENEPLIAIGFWHSNEEPHLPEPAWFVDKSWDKETKEKIIRYLTSKERISVSCGQSWCRFRCGEEDMGDSEFSDGIYVWPCGLIHYISKHHIRLPDEICKIMLNFENIETPIQNEFRTISFDYWINQKGWNRESNSFKNLNDENSGIITIHQLDTYKFIEQKEFLKNYLFTNKHISKKLNKINRIIKGEKVSILGKFLNFEDFISKGNFIGLEISFKELNYNEFQEELNKQNI